MKELAQQFFPVVIDIQDQYQGALKLGRYEKMMIKEGKISKYVFIEILDVGDSLKLKGIPIKLYTHAIYIKK